MVLPKQKKKPQSSRTSWQERLQKFQLAMRRGGAWVVEFSLIIPSGIVPFSVGLYVKENTTTETVPLNYILVTTQDAIAQTLGLPIYQKNRQVPPASNFLWTATLITPLIITNWKIYQLAVRGQTLPKRWFGIQVVTLSGNNPGLKRILVREVLGEWCLPAGIAFTVWRCIGADPDLVILTGLFGLFLLGNGFISNLNRQRRTLGDRLAGTIVLNATKNSLPGTGLFPPLPPRWLIQQQLSSGKNYLGNRQFLPIELQANAGNSQHSNHLWDLIRQYPRRSLLLLFLFCMGVMTGTFVATQVYIYNQTNQRIEEQQKNEVFIALARQLKATANGTLPERQSTILAIGAIKNDSRAIKLLVDLLEQEKDPGMSEFIQQTISKFGLESLPELRRLNQSLTKEIKALQATNQQSEIQPNLSKKLPIYPDKNKFNETDQEEAIVKNSSSLLLWQLRATQLVIANILALNSNNNITTDLSQINLSSTTINQSPSLSSAPIAKTKETVAPFVLVLDKIDLSGINFRGAALTGASFQGSQFWGPGKDGRWQTFDDWVADFSDAELKQANLTDANLNHVKMENTNLQHAVLNQANLFQGYLINANLSSAKLRGANLQKAVLKNATFTGADLTEANLSKANLQSANLTRIKAMGTQWQSTDLSQSDLREADLSMANFSRAKLNNANLSNTRLAGTNFSSAKLQNVSLRNADLKMADFRGANLDGADFEGAMFIAAKVNRADQFVQSAPNMSMGARVMGVNFTQVKNISSQQLTYICSQGGIHPRCQ